MLVWFFILSAFGIEVVRPEFKDDIVLKIVRVEADSFDTYLLTNHNARVMTLVCANNRVYDNNPKAYIEYRNYFNELAGNFTIEDNRVCLEMGKFIEQASFGVDEARPFIITLARTGTKVKRIEYPRFDPLADEGKMEDLLPKAPVHEPEPKKPDLDQAVKAKAH